jgi:hypothetical protein
MDRSFSCSGSLSALKEKSFFPGIVLLGSAGIPDVSPQRAAFDQREIHMSQGTSAHFPYQLTPRLRFAITKTTSLTGAVEASRVLERTVAVFAADFTH